jgi:signal transduction histidine kinase
VVTSLIERLFDRRATVLRVSLLAAMALGYLTLLAAPADLPGPVGGLLVVVAVAVSTTSARWPLACVLVQSGLLAFGEWVGDGGLVPLKFLASFAIFELAMRVSGPRVPVAGVVLGVVYVFVGLSHVDQDLAEVAYKTAVVVLGPMVLGVYIRGFRARVRQAEERATEQERLRRSEAQVARVAERTAIARELHDVVAHHVASIVLRVGVARHLDAGGGHATQQVLDDVHETGTSALTELRRLVAVLRDPAAPATSGADLVDPAELPAALAAVVERGRQVGLRIDDAVDPGIARLDAVLGLAVLRLAQEGLTNVAKHAGADARVRLRAELVDDGVLVEVHDDGGGARVALGRSGHGLTGMQERVALLGGTLRAGPDGTGWLLSAHLPARLPAGEARPVGTLP